MKNFLSGSYKPKFPEKWINKEEIKFRSHYERQAFKLLESHPSVKFIGSETIIVNYICPFDNKTIRRYYVDLEIHFTNGKKILVEIKPAKQTLDPSLKKPKFKSKNSKKAKNYIFECETFAKNQAKWKSAKSFARKMNFDGFEIWTEKELKELGIKL